MNYSFSITSKLGVGNVKGIQIESLTYTGHKIMLLFKYTMHTIHPDEKEEKQNRKHQIQPTNSGKFITELHRKSKANSE